MAVRAHVLEIGGRVLGGMQFGVLVQVRTPIAFSYLGKNCPAVMDSIRGALQHMGEKPRIRLCGTLKLN